MSSPRVEACIAEVMERHPGATPAAQARYFEAVHQELAPLARRLELELGTKMGHAGVVYDRLQTQADEWRRRALAAERRLNWLLENPGKVLDITRRWNPTQGTLLAHLENHVRQQLGEMPEASLEGANEGAGERG
jgi:hypothetical protein